MTGYEWAAANSAIILAVVTWLWRREQRIDTIYQHLFGVTGKNGTAGRIAALEKLVGEASGDPLASPAGRQLMRRLDGLEALAQAQGEVMNSFRSEIVPHAISKVASQMTTALNEMEEHTGARITDLDSRLRAVERRRH